jgi:hypothetical protein
MGSRVNFMEYEQAAEEEEEEYGVRESIGGSTTII